MILPKYNLFHTIFAGKNTAADYLALPQNQICGNKPRRFIYCIHEQADSTCLGINPLRPNSASTSNNSPAPCPDTPDPPPDGPAARPEYGVAAFSPSIRQVAVFEFGKRECVIAANAGRLFLVNGNKGFRQPYLDAGAHLPQQLFSSGGRSRNPAGHGFQLKVEVASSCLAFW